MPVEAAPLCLANAEPWTLYTPQHDRARTLWWLTDHECTRQHREHILTAAPTAQTASQHTLPGWAGQSSSSSAAVCSCTATVASSVSTSSPSCASRSDSTSTLACSSPEHIHMCVGGGGSHRKRQGVRQGVCVGECVCVDRWICKHVQQKQAKKQCVCERVRRGEGGRGIRQANQTRWHTSWAADCEEIECCRFHGLCSRHALTHLDKPAGPPFLPQPLPQQRTVLQTQQQRCAPPHHRPPRVRWHLHPAAPAAAAGPAQGRQHMTGAAHPPSTNNLGLEALC